MDSTGSKPHGPVLVALGSAGWGTEALFRRHLNARLAPYPIVLVEHLLQVIYTLPWLVRHRHEIRSAPRRALVWVVLSGSIGSALGTICFTAAMSRSSGINPTAAVVLLNLQPLVSTALGLLLFRERIRPLFYPLGAIAILSGAGLALGDAPWAALALGPSAGLLFTMGTILAWGFATAAGRGAMRDLPVEIAAPLRLWAGLATAALVVAARGEPLELAPLTEWPVIRDFLLLTSVAGVLPLACYFLGLRSTPAAIAGYCEMAYTLSATFVTWMLLDGHLSGLQLFEALLLLAAIVLLNRAHSAPADPSARQAA